MGFHKKITKPQKKIEIEKNSESASKIMSKGNVLLIPRQSTRQSAFIKIKIEDQIRK